MILLDMVQRILASIGSVNVETVSGSMEAEQVALIINRVYEEILSYRDWTFLRKKDNPVSIIDNYIYVLPDDLSNLEDVYYKDKKLTYIDFQDYNLMLKKRLLANKENIDNNGVYTNKPPFYYTSEAGDKIYVDGYVSNDRPSRLDITLYYIRLPKSPLFGDDDVVEMPKRLETVLLNGALALAYRELKGDMGASDRYYDAYRRGLASMRRWGRKIEDTKPTYGNINYGRRGY